MEANYMGVHPYPKYDRLRDVLSDLCTNEVRPCCVRLYRFASLDYAHNKTFLSGEGALFCDTRFGLKGRYRILYGSTSPELAMQEVLAAYKYFGIQCPSMHHIIRSFECDLTYTLDLASPHICALLGVSVNKIKTSDWRKAISAGREALTQAIGRDAFQCGLEALLAPSVHADKDFNVVIFPDNLNRQDSVRYISITSDSS